MNLFKLFSFKPKEAHKPVRPDTLPRMTNEKLAELIKGITAGKVIQMFYCGSVGWGDMTPRSLEEYLSVFLTPQTDYANFRVKPEASVEEASPTFATQQEVAEMGDKIAKAFKHHSVHIDSLYRLVLNHCNYNLNKGEFK